MKRRMDPNGPYGAPRPSEVEDERGLPMAVANDMSTVHDSFVPTTASPDAYAEDLLAWQAPAEEMLPHGHEATRAAERPPGYSRVDAHGFRHLLDEEEPG